MPYSKNQIFEHIIELQTYLQSISNFNAKIPSIIPDGNYSSATEKAVSAFQQEYDLPITGEVDKNCWDRIILVYRAIIGDKPASINPFSSNLYLVKEGDNGYIVYLIQIMLNCLGNAFGNIRNIQITGVYDIETSVAVRNFQKYISTCVTGMVDIATWNMLASYFNTLDLRSRQRDICNNTTN